MNVPPDDQHGIPEAIEQFAARIRQLEEELAELKSGLSALRTTTAESEPDEIVRAAVIEPEILDPEILDPEILDPEILDPEILDPEILDPEIIEPSARAAPTEVSLPAMPATAKSRATESGQETLHRIETLIGGRWLNLDRCCHDALGDRFFYSLVVAVLSNPSVVQGAGPPFRPVGVSSGLVFGLLGAITSVSATRLLVWGCLPGTARRLRHCGPSTCMKKSLVMGRYAFAALECSLITLVAIVLCRTKTEPGRSSCSQRWAVI